MDVDPTADLPELLELLELEEIDRDLYRATRTFRDPFALYGGQVAAQALRAAGLTVPEGRAPHSLHGYFLRSGDAERPTIFRVDRDRDGRSFSGRRVVAVQDGEVLFNMSCSFHTVEPGPEVQSHPLPEAGDPAALPVVLLPRLFSIESRQAPQPVADTPWPTRFWSRLTVTAPDDPLIHACVLTYLSDISSGLAGLPQAGQQAGPSLDHAVWFHRPARLDDWVLMDLVPQSTSGGRGWYTGSIYDQTGTLLASVAQESLFRGPR
ncbi:MAG: Choloyl-CoA hydrolase [Frankiales bacterium]|nr:Choloyl-CoA hydrolase [Frankiales bacterium]